LLPEIVTPVGEVERQISVSFDLLAARRPNVISEIDEIPEGTVSNDGMSREIVQLLNQTIGIFCLTKVRNSLLMWSHYADQYGGAVLEFDASHEFFASQIEVDYRTTRPRRDLSSYLTGSPIPVAELCTKSDQWAYEQEVRIVRQLAACKEVGRDDRGFPVFVQQIPIAAIKGVILGERTPVEVQREIFGRVYESHVALSLAAVDHAGFSFREERIKFAVPISEMGPMVSPRTAHIFCELKSELGEMARWMIENHPSSRLVNRRV